MDPFRTRGYLDPVPKGFVPRDLVALINEFQRGFDGTRTLIMGPKKRVSKANITGHRNSLNKVVGMGGEGKI